MKKLYIKISKFLSFILRHQPEKFGIELDSEGFAGLKQILEILNKKYRDININEITKDTIEEIIKQSNKKRFEIIENKIRAFYGHSLNEKIEMPEAKSLPPKLYHGTTLKAYNKIKTEGLTKRGRQYVHLSDRTKNAIVVGKRKTKNPIILIINVLKAQRNGVKFYKSGDMYLTDYIKPYFISKLEKIDDNNGYHN